MSLDTNARDALERIARDAEPDDLAHVLRYLGYLEIKHYGSTDLGNRPLDVFATDLCARCGEYFHYDAQDAPPGMCPPCARAAERTDT